MRSYTLAFSILAILGGAQAAPDRGRCHARPHRPSAAPANETLPSATSSADVASSLTSQVLAPSSVEAAPSDVTTTEVMTTVTETSVSSSSAAADVSTASAEDAQATASSASDVPVSATDSSSAAASPTSAEPSVVSTPSSSSEVASASDSAIGGELAVPTGPASSAAGPAVSGAAGNNPAAPAGDGASDHRIGLGVNGETGPLTPFVGGGSKLGWYYNWALDANSDSAGLEHVPMVWGEPSVAEVSAASRNWQDVSYVLGFNEPDQTIEVGGCDLDPGLAAILHQQWVGNLGGESSPFQIGSPAVARGGKGWMTEWLDACQDKCLFDFVPFHFYGTDVNALIDYVQDFSETFNKPLWLTEWSCRDYSTGEVCDQTEVEQFMTTAVAYFRKSGLVERWAWFGAFPSMASTGDANGLQNADGSVNQMGSLYLQL